MRTIKSSDIASYLYCPVSWWIGLKEGVKITKPMIKGEKHHNFVSKNQPKAKFLYVSMIVTVVILLIFIIYRFLG